MSKGNLQAILAFVGLFIVFGILSWIFLRPAVADFKRDIALRDETEATTELSHNVFKRLGNKLDWYWDADESDEFEKPEESGLAFDELLLRSRIRILLESKPLNSFDPLILTVIIEDLIDLNSSLVHFKRELKRIYDNDRYSEKFCDKGVAREIREYLEKSENSLVEMTNLIFQAADAWAITWTEGRVHGIPGKTRNKEKCCEMLEKYMKDYLSTTLVGQLNHTLGLMKQSLMKQKKKSGRTK